MLCSDIMDKNPLTLTPDTSVTDALAQLKDAGICGAAVTDASGTVMGFFSLRHLLENTLPVSMVSESGFGGVLVNAAPGLELRLQKILQQDVAAVMDRRFFSVHPDTAAARAAQLIAERGADIVVLDEDTGHLKGIISDYIMIDGLLSASLARNKKVAS